MAPKHKHILLLGVAGVKYSTIIIIKHLWPAKLNNSFAKTVRNFLFIGFSKFAPF